MSKSLTPQQQITEHNKAIGQIDTMLKSKQNTIKVAQSAIKKYRTQIKTITLQKELTLRSNNMCFDCHKNLSSDEVKFCIDKSLNPLCQACQQKSRSQQVEN